jgi:hypothetical protein
MKLKKHVKAIIILLVIVVIVIVSTSIYREIDSKYKENTAIEVLNINDNNASSYVFRSSDYYIIASNKDVIKLSDNSNKEIIYTFTDKKINQINGNDDIIVTTHGDTLTFLSHDGQLLKEISLNGVIDELNLKIKQLFCTDNYLFIDYSSYTSDNCIVVDIENFNIISNDALIKNILNINYSNEDVVSLYNISIFDKYNANLEIGNGVITSLYIYDIDNSTPLFNCGDYLYYRNNEYNKHFDLYIYLNDLYFINKSYRDIAIVNDLNMFLPTTNDFDIYQENYEYFCVDKDNIILLSNSVNNNVIGTPVLFSPELKYHICDNLYIIYPYKGGSFNENIKYIKTSKGEKILYADSDVYISYYKEEIFVKDIINEKINKKAPSEIIKFNGSYFVESCDGHIFIYNSETGEYLGNIPIFE